MHDALGQQLWTALHTWAWQQPRELLAEDQRAAREWLAAFALDIPSYGCRCRSEWRKALQICPPPLDHGPALYWWTVALHDRINRMLHKPLAAPTWSMSHPLLHTLLT